MVILNTDSYIINKSPALHMKFKFTQSISEEKYDLWGNEYGMVQFEFQVVLLHPKRLRHEHF